MPRDRHPRFDALADLSKRQRLPINHDGAATIDNMKLRVLLLNATPMFPVTTQASSLLMFLVLVAKARHRRANSHISHFGEVIKDHGPVVVYMVRLTLIKGHDVVAFVKHRRRHDANGRANRIKSKRDRNLQGAVFGDGL